MPWHQLIGFALAVTPIMLTPGVSATLVVQRVAKEGPHAGFQVAAGTACGLLVHAGTAVVGIAALVAQSAVAFQVLKTLGAIYLVALGINLIRSAGREDDRAIAGKLPWTIDGAFAQALLANVLNPRAASVYLTLAPQFIAPGDDVAAMTLALASVHIAMQTAWLSVWTVVVSGARRGLGSAALRQPVERLAGVVLIGLGVRTVAQGTSR